MANEYLASVVVLVWGRADLTLAFVQHLTSVTPPGLFELVMVDMGSADATPDVLAALSGDVQVSRLPAQTSFATGADLGAKMARGQYLAFLDATCRPSPGWLERTAALLGTYAQVGAVGPVLRCPGQPLPVAGLALAAHGDGKLSALARYQARGIAPQVEVAALPYLAAVVRRDALCEVGGFDEAYRDALEDVDLCLRLREAGWAVLVDLEASVTLAGPTCRPLCPGGEGADIATLTNRWRGRVAPDVIIPDDGAAKLCLGPTVTSRSGSGWGANVTGYFEAELGIGESARLVVEAIEAAGGECATNSYYRHHNRAEHKFRHRFVASEGRYPFPFNVLCLGGDMLPCFVAENPHLLAGRYSIAMWHWEMEELPASYAAALDLVDEVWAGSDFARRAIAASTTKPVVTLPLPVQAREGRPMHSRAEAGIPDGFVFGFMFDANSTLDRKNPDGVVMAFCRAFRPGEGPLLVVKTTNGERAGVAEKLRSLGGGRPDVVVVDGYLAPEVAASWTGLVDCYVSLHRSEGFGLTIAEAMAWGTPVVVTGYSGNLDFTNNDNAFLVPWAPGTVPPGNPSYPAGGRWAEPDLDAAAGLLRQVWEDPDEARRRAERGRDELRVTHSLPAAARVVSQRVAEIQRSMYRTGRPSHQGHAPGWHAGPLPEALGRRARQGLPKLNIGAGDDRRDGYWSVDLRPDVADVVADITRLPFADDSVAELFASDLLEHFPATKTQGLLAEWRRVLAPGGKLTLRVPNLLALARLLIEHPHTRPDVIRNIYGGHRFGPDGAWDTHHTGWTPDLLHEELTRAGFLVMSDDGGPNNTVTAMRAG